MNNPYLHNPQLNGAPFFLEAPGPDAALLFHGFTATCHEVARLGEVLHAQGYTVSGPMLPGHGTQPEDLNRVRWQDWIEAAEAEYEKLTRTHERVVVGGESNGALVTLALAERHPEISAVLAYAPALKLPLNGFQRLQLRLFAPIVASMPKGDLQGNTTWQGYRVNPLRGVLEHMRLQQAVRARLAQVTQPILIVQGRQDQTIDPQSAQIVYDRVRSQVKELHWMDHSGHCVLLEDEQDEVHRLTRDFLCRMMG